MRGGVDLRDRRQQRLGVGHAHFLEQCRRRRAFDDAAGIHHRDFVGAAGNHAEVMGDQDHRHVAAALLARQQIEDLRLDGDVERRGRLVGDQQFRLARQRDRNRDPLPHAAGELMRILHQSLLRARECRPRRATRRCAVFAAWPSSSRCSCSVSISCVPMVSTGLSEVIGSWNTTASERPRSLRRRSRSKARQILPVEHHAAGKLGLLRQQLQDGARQHGLAAAGFADDAERAAGADA